MDLATLWEYHNRLDAQRSSLFDNWPIAPDFWMACPESLCRTLETLIALGHEATGEDALDVLRRCVERFNELDEGFIRTIERDELCDMLYEIGDPCGPGTGDPSVEIRGF